MHIQWVRTCVGGRHGHAGPLGRVAAGGRLRLPRTPGAAQVVVFQPSGERGVVGGRVADVGLQNTQMVVNDNNQQAIQSCSGAGSGAATSPSTSERQRRQ